MNQWLPIIAIALSVISIGISAANFLWSLYKDTRYRVSVQVTVSLQRLVNHGERWTPVMDVVNYGPGTITLDFIMCDSRNFFRRMRDRYSHKTITYAQSPIGKKLEPGETYRDTRRAVFCIGRRHAPSWSLRPYSEGVFCARSPSANHFKTATK